MEDSKPVQTRRRLDEQSWRAVLERFDGAAMTVQAFCLREGLTRSSFTRWRARLRSGPKRRLAPAVAKAAAPAPAPAPRPPFVDLGLLGVGAAATAAEHAGLDLRIELGGGLSLHLVRR
jgi:putative transposase